MPHYLVAKKTDTPAASIMLCNDNIMRVEFKSNAEVTPKDLEQIFAVYNQMSAGKVYPYIYYAEDGSVIYTEEARLYSKKHEDDFKKLCIAVVVGTLAHKLIANFYLRFNKPACLLRIFDHMDEAEAWCAEQYHLSNPAQELI